MILPTNCEEGPIPLSTAEKNEIKRKIESFIAEHPISLVEDNKGPVCNKVDCYCRIESAFMLAE